MMSNTDILCFCGSGKPYSDCHNYIYENSYVASLYKLQRDIDQEIEKQAKEKEIEIECKRGCCECCSQCFCVSETEFVQILDFMKRERPQNELLGIIEKSKYQWNFLKANDPLIAQKLQSTLTLRELWQLNTISLPFSCIFLDKGHSCTIYKIRPLICRICGVGYSTILFNRPCHKNPDQYWIDFTSFDKRMNNFLFLNDQNKTIIRRPVPLFYYFQLMFQDESMIHQFSETELYKDLLELDQKDYVKKLIGR